MSPLRASVLVGVTLCALGLAVVHATAHPPRTPDHGINDTTFYKLWANDEDAPNRTALRDRVGDAPSEMQELAAGSDIPLNDPPEAVERWNRRDLNDFPATGADRSVYPPHATLTGGRFLADAYAEVFAVQPSTRARLTGADESQPLYVPPNGTVLGTVDYRVEVPPDDTTGGRRVLWSLRSHRVAETRLVIDGQTETNASGSHTPHLAYTALDTYVGSRHRLTLEADITATLRKEVRECTARDPDTGVCTNWDVTVTFPSESVTVRDSVGVRLYTLTVTGFRTRYPNGDLGLVVFKNRPWLGYTAPDGKVRGVWRFYAGRKPTWDTVVTSTDDGTSESHSPLHPLQIHAYPIETGPTPEPRDAVTLLATYGRERTPPALPPNVQLDAVTDPYTASNGIAARLRTDQHDLRTVTAEGLVRDVDTTLQPDNFVEIPYRRSNLTLAVQETSAATVTVRVVLRDRRTGTPIGTASRDGYIVINGQRVNTSADGTVTLPIRTNGSGISARYEPGRWWRTSTAYTGDSDVIYAGGTTLQLVRVLYQASIPVAVVLVSVFLIDRTIGWDIWPPWGRH